MIVDNQKKVMVQLTFITDDEFLRRMPRVLNIFRLEPRLSFAMTLDPLSSFKINYTFLCRHIPVALKFRVLFTLKI